MEPTSDTVFAAVNTPGVRDVLAAGGGLDALSIGKFHAAFARATKVAVIESDFRARVAEDLRSGRYCDSSLFNHFVSHARYSLECTTDHKLLPDQFSYQIEGRPRIDGRTWYTQLERHDAALLCMNYPLIPLAHMMLVSLATDQIFDFYTSNDSPMKKGDFYSFIMRWNPDNTTGEVVPAVAIMLFRSYGLPQRTEPLEDIIPTIESDKIKNAYLKAKDFVVSGGFFSLSLLDRGGERVNVTCPGMSFMRTYWDIQQDIYDALVRDQHLPPLVGWQSSIREVYKAALVNGQ